MQPSVYPNVPSVPNTVINSESMFDVWKQRLQQLKNLFSAELRRSNNALIVFDRDTSYGPPEHHSIGVTSVLTNFYIPSPSEQKQIDSDPNPTKKRNYLSTAHVVDPITFENKFKLLHESSFERHDHAMVISHVLSSLNLFLLPFAEFPLGSHKILVRETAHKQAPWLYLTGLIDDIAYNPMTQKIVIIERKSSESSYMAAANSMHSLHLKVKHSKQITMYTKMLLAMAMEKSIPITAKDVELLIIATNLTKKKVSAWRLIYDPITFLGGEWNGDRWHDLLGEHVNFEVEKPILQQPGCVFCGDSTKKLYKTKSEPVWLVCIDCRSKNLCPCGNLARIIDKSNNTKYCSRLCKTRRFSPYVRSLPAEAHNRGGVANPITVVQTDPLHSRQTSLSEFPSSLIPQATPPPVPVPKRNPQPLFNLPFTMDEQGQVFFILDSN